MAYEKGKAAAGTIVRKRSLPIVDAADQSILEYDSESVCGGPGRILPHGRSTGKRKEHFDADSKKTDVPDQ